MPEKILVVDDEQDLLTALKESLVREGFKVLTAKTGKEGLRLAVHEHPSLILLDVMMPEMNGYDVLAALRKREIKTPVIMLTASSTEEDKVRGLDTGADDYVTKPFSRRELLSRINAVRRRQAGEKGKVHQVTFGGVKVDFEHQVVQRKGRTVKLSSCESELLRLLVTRKGEAVSRQAILTQVWGYEFPPDTRTIDNHIVRLRQKLEDDPRHPRHILTAHGVGYKFSQ